MLFVLIILVVFMQLTTNYFVNAGFPFLFWVLAALLMAGTGTRVRRHWTASPRSVPVHDWLRTAQPSARAFAFSGPPA